MKMDCNGYTVELHRTYLYVKLHPGGFIVFFGRPSQTQRHPLQLRYEIMKTSLWWALAAETILLLVCFWFVFQIEMIYFSTMAHADVTVL